MPLTLKRPKILICEDEILIASDLTSRLELLGYSICGLAPNGEVALKLVEQHQPDLVMMDIVLRGNIDGIEVANTIRDKWSIPVIFLTAYADTEHLERAKLTYPFGYLLKPFQDRELKITTEMALYVAKADAEKKAAQKQLKLFMDNLPGVAFIKDERGKLVFSNEKYFEVLGLKRKDIEGKAYDEYLSSDVANAFRRVDDWILSRNEGVETIDPFPDESGNTYWLTKEFPIKKSKDEYLIGGISIDITDQIKLQEKLKDGGDNKQTLFNRFFNPVFIIDDNGYFVVCNEAALSLFESSEDDISKYKIDNYLMEYDGNGRDIFNGINRKPVSEVEIKLNVNGSFKYLDLYIAPIMWNKRIMTYCHVNEIKEQKLSGIAINDCEKIVRFLAEKSDDILWLNTCGMKETLYVNNAFEKIFSINIEDLYANPTSFLDFVHQKDIAEVTNLINRYHKNHKQYECEYRIVDKNGVMKWINEKEYPVSELINGKNVMAGVCIDITERKFRDEYNGLKAKIIDSVGQAVIATDIGGYITFWNKAAEYVYGWSCDEALGRNIADVIPSEQKLQKSNEIQEKLQNGEAWSEEFEVMRRDGSKFIAQMTDTPVLNDNRELTGIICVSDDISERKLAENQLRERDQIYRFIYERTTVGLTKVSLDFIIEAANKSFCNMLGYHEEELIGMSVADITHPDDLISNIREHSRLANGEIEYYQMEKVYINKGGFSVHCIIEPCLIRDEDGNPDYALGSVIDISELKETQKHAVENQTRAKVILNAINDAVFLHPMRKKGFGKIIEVNAIACERYGYSRNEFMTMTVADITRKEEVDTYAAESWRSKFREIGQITFETVHFTKDGKNIPAEINSYLFDMDNEKVIVSVARDITERKLAEKITIKSLREKETLLKELNHRVKNNMQVIISLMRLQADQIEDERVKASIQDTQNRIFAMAAVHETLHKSEDITIINLAEYLSRLSETTFHTYRTDCGTIRFYVEIQSILINLEKSYPIGLVVNELLSNSLKYAFPMNLAGSISISGKQSNNIVNLVVSDTGIGIPPEIDWRKADSLGLQIVRSLVEEQLGGTIRLNSENGTKWTITFPV